jgi:hypothetical protein
LSQTPIDQEQLLGESEKGSNGMANDRIWKSLNTPHDRWKN